MQFCEERIPWFSCGADVVGAGAAARALVKDEAAAGGGFSAAGALQQGRFGRGRTLERSDFQVDPVIAGLDVGQEEFQTGGASLWNCWVQGHRTGEGTTALEEEPQSSHVGSEPLVNADEGEAY